MGLENKTLSQYLENTCDAESALLEHIRRETYLKETQAHMLSGHYQGRLLSFLSKLIRPSSILEIGTFTGYSTLCLAEGLAEQGIIHTIDKNEELADRVEGYFNQSQYCPHIRRYYGDAIQLIPTIDGRFDLVFIDADKKNNLNYFQMVVDRIPSGGLILIDNVLWKGRVLDENPDHTTSRINELNSVIAGDASIDKLILPIRDGLYIVRKR